MADFLDISTEIRSGGALASDIGRTLYLSRAASAPIDYSDSKAVARILGFTEHTSTDTLADAGLNAPAGVYFGQDPYPRSLLTGYRLDVATPHVAIGGRAGTTGDIDALGPAAGAGLQINGVAGAAADGDFDGVDSYTGGTTPADDALETLIQSIGGRTGATVSFDAAENVFVITSNVSFGAGFSGDVARAFGLDAATIYPAIGLDEGYDEALTRLTTLGADFGWLVPATSIVDDANAEDSITALAAWINARDKSMVFDAFGAGVLVAEEVSSVPAVVSARKQNRIAAIYNGPVIDHKAIGYAALFSSVNYLGVRTVRSGAHKQIQGVTANRLSAAEKRELTRKRINYYEADGARTFTREGWTFGTWIDVQAFANWFNGAVEQEMYTTLTERDVEQNDRDLSLKQAIASVCEIAVTNGAISPGELDPRSRGDVISVTGNQNFRGYLPRGYFVYAPSYNSQTRTDRNLRRAVQHTVWLHGTGFVNSADLRAIFQP